MNKPSLVPIVLISSTLVISVALALIIQQHVMEVTREQGIEKQNQLKLLSDRINLRLSNAISAINITSRNPIMQSTPYSSFISSDLKGIPSDMDMPKRIIATNVMDVFKGFEYVFYAMPNGDLYITEPYTIQVNNSQLNFAFRDWYKGSIKNHDVYVSEVYVSATTKHNVIAISSPIYQKENGTLVGMWVGVLNLNIISHQLDETNLGGNEKIAIFDQHGTIIASNDPSDFGKFQSAYADEINQAIAGKNSLSTKSVDGVSYVVAYSSIPLYDHNWAVVSVQPYDDAYKQADVVVYTSKIILTIIIIISVISGIMIYRSSHKDKVLRRNLETLNQELEDKSKKLQEKDKAKEEFSAMITHELKTPLVPIAVYCKMLKKQLLGSMNKEQMEAIETIEKNTKRLETLISDIMDARKLDLDKMKFYPEEVTLDELFNNMNSDYAESLQQNGKQFVTNVPTSGLVIETDKSRLRQVFDNLISNAIKFTGEKDGKIEVGFKKEDSKIIFYVKDNGMGIPKEHQKELFKKFYQIDTTERRKAGGTGLGLAISKGIIEKMGGKIWVESDGTSGSTFYFELNT
ncbi:Sensor protein [Nitrosotalea sinensis]|uniref:histidine kinase n=1 Tax=Nitrosotalea sinensis TaxID=1499975 RepID=A0A2H1EHC4_9ARCH|nr:sensor histidine kinase [Candidatus Nitrosotalea sinensis]SHO45563.1 Sensor protein [Candidatus Nitrosotalea sinensis]